MMLNTDRRLSDIQRQIELDPENQALRLAYYQLRSKIEGRRVYLELLSERRLWAFYSRELQDLAIDQARRLLSPTLTYTGTQEYECQGLSHRIASFELPGLNYSLLLLPGGQYQLGSVAHHWEQPTRRLTVPAFLLGQYLVNQEQWDVLGGEDFREWTGPELPIMSVAWHTVQEWLTELGPGFRLASEAEWEYACRAGSTSRYFWGEQLCEDYCWIQSNSGGHCHSVYSHQGYSNAFGLVDMLGHVWEWCQDTWRPHYQDGPTDHRARADSDDKRRVLRGGGWRFFGNRFGSTVRHWGRAQYPSSIVGFRIACSLTDLSTLP